MSLRIIDANLNRAREGLRTAEEYARLVLNDAAAANALKNCRRLLQECAACFGDALLAARDIENDPGTRPQADDVRRATERDVAAAGMKRAQEALRVIEEFAQVLQPSAAPPAAKARYAAYAAEQQLMVAAPRRMLLRQSPVMVIFSDVSARADWRDVLKSLLDADARLFQLRQKHGSARSFAAMAAEFVAAAGAAVIVNDRPDIAAVAGAAGVHVGQDDLSVAAARAVVGAAGIVGVSTHDAEEAARAEAEGADYIGLGAMFHTTTKNVESMAGPAMISRVKTGVPVFCIGGITSANVPELVRHGARQVAVSGAILNAPDPAAEYRKMCSALSQERV